MDNAKQKRKKSRCKRVLRVRKKVRGSKDKPRLSVSKTNRHIYAQIIDDEAKLTLVGVGTLSKEFAKKRKSKESAREVGKRIAELAKKKNIETIVFDRGRYKYHGLVAQLAEGAREAGLQF